VIEGTKGLLLLLLLLEHLETGLMNQFRMVRGLP
jgi:hypothetical protein